MLSSQQGSRFNTHNHTRSTLPNKLHEKKLIQCSDFCYLFCGLCVGHEVQADGAHELRVEGPRGHGYGRGVSHHVMRRAMQLVHCKLCEVLSQGLTILTLQEWQLSTYVRLYMQSNVNGRFFFIIINLPHKRSMMVTKFTIHDSLLIHQLD